jgi:hypothetical protein
MMIKSSKSSLLKAAILVLVIVFLIMSSANIVLASKDCSSSSPCHQACDYSVYYDCTSGSSCNPCYYCFDCYTNGYCSYTCGICGGSCTTDVECSGLYPTCDNPPNSYDQGCTCVPEFSPGLGLVALFSAVSISTLIYKYKKRS